MKKALIITYYWPPSGGAGVQRWLKFTKYFKLFGIEPTVITVNPNKASYPVIDESLKTDVPKDIRVFTTNTFEPYGAYKKMSKNSEIPYSGFANESNPTFAQQVARFVRGNFFIPDARKGWNKYAISKASELIETESFDVIITTSPPHSTQLIGLKLKEKYKLPWIADLRDPWTDIYYYKQMNHTLWAKKADAKMERLVLEKSNYIIVVSDAIKKMFAAKTETINQQKIKIIPNGFDDEDFSNSFEKQNDIPVITYTGTLSEVYDTRSFIKVFSNLKYKTKLRLIGKISDEFLNQLPKDKIEVIDHVEHHKSIKYLRKSDVLLLIIPKIDNNEGILTGKLFEYLAARKPIIAIGPTKGEASSIIDKCEAGKMFDYNDEYGLETYLNNLLSGKVSINLNNKKYLNFSRKELTKKLAQLI